MTSLVCVFSWTERLDLSLCSLTSSRLLPQLQQQYANTFMSSTGIAPPHLDIDTLSVLSNVKEDISAAEAYMVVACVRTPHPPTKLVEHKTKGVLCRSGTVVQKLSKKAAAAVERERADLLKTQVAAPTAPTVSEAARAANGADSAGASAVDDLPGDVSGTTACAPASSAPSSSTAAPVSTTTTSSRASPSTAATSSSRGVSFDASATATESGVVHGSVCGKTGEVVLDDVDDTAFDTYLLEALVRHGTMMSPASTRSSSASN